jgi:hypothetical protein
VRIPRTYEFGDASVHVVREAHVNESKGRAWRSAGQDPSLTKVDRANCSNLAHHSMEEFLGEGMRHLAEPSGAIHAMIRDIPVVMLRSRASVRGLVDHFLHD